MANGPGGNEIGRAAIRIVPDTTGFAASLLTYLKKLERELELNVDINVDESSVAASAKRAVRAAEAATGDVKLGVDLDEVGLRRQLKELSQFAGFIGVDVTPEVDRAKLALDAQKAIRQAEAAIEKIDIDPAVDKTRLTLSAQRAINAAEKAVGKINVPLEIDQRGIARASRSLGRLERNIGPGIYAAARLGTRGLRTFFGTLDFGVANLPRQAKQLAFGIAALGGPGLATVGTLLSTLPALGIGVGAAAATIALGFDGIKEAAQAAVPAVDALKASLSATFRDNLQPVFERIGDTLLPALDGPLNQLAASMTQAFAGIVDVLTSAEGLSNLTSSITGFALFIDDIQVGLRDLTSGFLIFARVATEAMSGVSASGDTLSEVINGFSAGFKDLAERLGANGVLRGAFLGLGSIASGVGVILLDLLETGLELANTFGPRLGRALENISIVIGPLGEILGSIGTGIFELAAGISVALAPVLDALAPAIESTVTNIVDKLVPVLPELASSFGRVVEAILPFVDAAVNALAPVLPQLAEVFAEIAEAILPALAEVLDQVAPLLPTLAQAVGDVVLAIVPLLPQLVELAIQLLPVLADILPDVVGLFEDLAPLVIALVGAFTDLVGPVTDFIGPLGTLALLTIPRLVGAGGLPALIGLLRRLTPLLVGLGIAAGPAADEIVTFLDALSGGENSAEVEQKGFEARRAIELRGEAFLAQLQNNPAGFIGLVIENFGNVSTLEDLFAAAAAAVDDGVTTIAGSIEGASDGFEDELGRFRDLGFEIPASLADGITDGEAEAIAAAGGLASFLFDGLINGADFRAIEDALRETGQMIPSWLTDGITKEEQKVIEAAGGLAEYIVEALDLGDDLRESSALAIRTFKDTLKGIKDPEIPEIFGGVGEEAGRKFDEGLAGTYPPLLNKWEEVKNNMVDVFQGTPWELEGDKVGRRFVTGYEGTAPLGPKVAQGIKDAILGIWNDPGAWHGAGSRTGQGYADGVKSAQDSVKNAADSLKNAAVAALDDGRTKAYAAGSFVGGGFADGIKSQESEVKAAAASLANAATAAINSAAKIASPSKVARESGEFIGEGFRLGILSSEQMVASAGGTLARAAIPSGEFNVGGRGGGTTLNVFPAEGMDEEQLAGRVIRKLDGAVA